MRPRIILVQKSLGGTPKEMAYETDLGEENYYISFV